MSDRVMFMRFNVMVVAALAVLQGTPMTILAADLADPERVRNERRADLAVLPLHWLIAADRQARAALKPDENWHAAARAGLATTDTLRANRPEQSFERLAHAERAIGAAVNAYLASTDAATTDSARLLLSDGLRAVGQHYAARTFAPPARTSRAGTAAPRILSALDPPPTTARIGAWLVHCDALRHCTAVLHANDGTALILERAAGPGTPLDASFLLHGISTDVPVTLRIGRWRQVLVSAPAMRRRDVPPRLLDALVERIATGGELRLGAAGRETDWRLQTSGGAEMLRYLDRMQEREGYSSALARRGRKAETGVPLAPPPRDIHMRPGQLSTMDTQLPADVREFWRHGCGEASMIERLPPGPATRVEHLAFSDGSEVWRLPCRSGVDRMLSVVLFRQNGNLQALTSPYRHDGIEPRPLLLEQPAFHWLPATAFGAAILPGLAPPLKPDALGDIGMLALFGHETSQPESCRTAWVWTGRWFERAETACAVDTRLAGHEVILDRERILLEP